MSNFRFPGPLGLLIEPDDADTLADAPIPGPAPMPRPSTPPKPEDPPADSLHPDQWRYKGFTVSQVETLYRDGIQPAIAAYIAAEAKLSELDDPSLTSDDRREKWNLELYHCWFGEWSAHRERKIRRRFARARRLLQTDELRFKLAQHLPALGMAPPGLRRIYIAPTFYSATWSTDRRTALIAHETTHLAHVLSSPEVYGRGNSLRLASNRADRAANNAENYMYFAMECFTRSPDELIDPGCSIASTGPVL